MLSISSPTLLLDEQKCRENIRRMVQKAGESGTRLKPHFKTHQSLAIGTWFRDEGVEAITVSSIQMAEYFAGDGWKDITIAFPVNVLEIDRINRLGASVELSVLVSDPEAAPLLDRKLNTAVSAYIEIDTGSNRTGFSPLQVDQVVETARRIISSAHIKLAGIYSHPGHSYASRSKVEVRQVYQNALNIMKEVKSKLDGLDDDIRICLGDTPCCSVIEHFDGVDEISPGNFVFYDLMQTQIGSCAMDDIAVVLACPVVARYPERNEVAIHGGAIHLSKESLTTGKISHYGYPVRLTKSGWLKPENDSYVRKLSQEHGIISCSSNLFESLRIGDLVGVFPVHSCLTAECMMGYLTLERNRLDHLRSSFRQ